MFLPATLNSRMIPPRGRKVKLLEKLVSLMVSLNSFWSTERVLCYNTASTPTSLDCFLSLKLGENRYLEKAPTCGLFVVWSRTSRQRVLGATFSRIRSAKPSRGNYFILETVENAAFPSLRRTPGVFERFGSTPPAEKWFACRDRSIAHHIRSAIKSSVSCSPLVFRTLLITPVS